jgi:hypothetical protein
MCNRQQGPPALASNVNKMLNDMIGHQNLSPHHMKTMLVPSSNSEHRGGAAHMFSLVVTDAIIK